MGLYIYIKRLDPPPTHPLECREEPELAYWDKPWWRCAAYKVFDVPHQGFDGGWLDPRNWEALRERALNFFLETEEHDRECSCDCSRWGTESIIDLLRICQQVLESGEPEKYFIGWSKK